MLESPTANRTFRAGVDPQRDPLEPSTTHDPQIHPQGYPDDEDD